MTRAAPRTEIGKNGVQARHMKRVRAAGGRSYKFTSPARRNVPDCIDLLGFEEATRIVKTVKNCAAVGRCSMCEAIARRIVAAAIRFTECKAPGKKPRAGQLREHARIRRLGFEVDIVR